MNCYECAKAGDSTAAVAVCTGCNAGLCLHHLREAARDLSPGGTRIGCRHDTWDMHAGEAADRQHEARS